MARGSGAARGASRAGSPASGRRKECLGLGSLPNDVQNRLIRAIYPDPSEGDESLARLLLKGAVSRRSAASVPVCKELHDLVDEGHVCRAGSRFWLSNTGECIAEGALLLYPELRRLEKGVARTRRRKMPPIVAV